MHEWLTALSDAARWRIVLLIAERPRSVGVVAELTGLRQPQASKHLQTLERAGVAVSRRSGQRRIYALEPEALRSLGMEMQRVAELADPGRILFDQHSAAVDAEVEAAERPRWADGRTYVFRRSLPAASPLVWRHLTEPALLSQWWAPNGLRLARVEWGSLVGTPLMQTYVEADYRGGDDGVVGESTGRMESVDPGRKLSFVLSPKLPDGSFGFSGHYDWQIAATESGTDFEVSLQIDDTAVPSAEFIAGIELGWNQSLDRLALLLAGLTNEKEPK